MNEQKKWLTIKYSLYTVLIILLYVLQSTPGFLLIFDVKPNLAVPAAICIAMREGEFVGGLYGAFAGALCDLGGPYIFGLNAIIFLIAGTAAGLLVIYMLRPGVINFVFLTAGALFTRSLLDYLFHYAMWEYENVWMVLVYHLLPGVLYSAAVSPLCYFAANSIYKYFAVKLQR